MTTRERISALRNECDEFAEQTLQCEGEFHPDFHTVSDERFYAIAHEAGAASMDAEIDQLRAELEYDQRNAAMSQSESARLLDENTKLRAELAAAIAACKAKDAALQSLVISGERSSSDCDAHQLYCEVKRTEVKKGRKALAIQPDDSALKAWLGKPVAWEYADAFGTHYTDDRRDWMDTPGIESVTHLYSPKGLK